MSARFIRRGVSKILWSPTIADIRNVTRAEITSAEDITDHIADINGWQLENNSAATPDMGSAFEGSIPGTNSMNASSITLYEDLEDEEVELMFPQLASGFIIILRKGDKPGSNSLDCHPARVASKAPEISMGNDPARTVVTFNVYEEPGLDGEVPQLAPTITTVTPSTGSTTGSTSITIAGTGFVAGSTTVTVGGSPATSVSVASATSLTCNTPAHAAGQVPVVVTTPYGTATKANGFTYS